VCNGVELVRRLAKEEDYKNYECLRRDIAGAIDKEITIQHVSSFPLQRKVSSSKVERTFTGDDEIIPNRGLDSLIKMKELQAAALKQKRS
jgi:hypothetical protein